MLTLGYLCAPSPATRLLFGEAVGFCQFERGAHTRRGHQPPLHDLHHSKGGGRRESESLRPRHRFGRVAQTLVCEASTLSVSHTPGQVGAGSEQRRHIRLQPQSIGRAEEKGDKYSKQNLCSSSTLLLYGEIDSREIVASRHTHVLSAG